MVTKSSLKNVLGSFPNKLAKTAGQANIMMRYPTNESMHLKITTDPDHRDETASANLKQNVLLRRRQATNSDHASQQSVGHQSVKVRS